MIARVSLSKASYGIDKLYDYKVPCEMEGLVCRGMRVWVPFGRGNRKCEGIVMSVYEDEKCDSKLFERLKSISHITDEAAVFDEKALELASFIRGRCFCTYFEAARIMLPSGMWGRVEEVYLTNSEISVAEAYSSAGKSDICIKILDVLYDAGKKMTAAEIAKNISIKSVKTQLAKLVKDRAIVREYEIKHNVYDSFRKMIKLEHPELSLEQMLSARQKNNPVYLKIITVLKDGDKSFNELCYLTGAGASAVNTLKKRGIISEYRQEVYRRPQIAAANSGKDSILNEKQMEVYNGLRELFDSPKAEAALLFGVTGCGKTEVYIHLIKYAVSKGKGAIVLVPEISLTPQISSKFKAVFGDNTAILHSRLSDGERLDEWKRIKRGEANIVIGTRSAVFAPVKELGVIIVDEEQDRSFVSEETPKYNAIDAAKYRCVTENALLLSGSATPSVESFYNAQKGIYSLFTLKERFSSGGMPEVMISDMRGTISNGKGSILGSTMIKELSVNLEKKEQSIILLNRRGSDRIVTCGGCGKIPHCRRCSNPLSYHSVNRRLMCHYCGYSEDMTESCPECGSKHIFFDGAGTQKLEEEILKLFPSAAVVRMDADTTSAKKSHEELLDEIYLGKADILIGTQMITKGLDFENVTLAGVVDADMSLYSGDYMAAERTFSLITQVVGRAGRRSRQGRAVIQTLTPDNFVIKSAANQNYEEFYNEEIKIRQMLDLPPFMDIVTFVVSSEVKECAYRAADRLKSRIEGLMNSSYSDLKADVLGPAPPRLAKVNNRYRFNISFRCKSNAKLRKFAADVLREFLNKSENRGTAAYAAINQADI